MTYNLISDNDSPPLSPYRCRRDTNSI